MDRHDAKPWSEIDFTIVGPAGVLLLEVKGGVVHRRAGTWYVQTHTHPLQPYFESGFPYGHHQWISAAGTSWAAMATESTLPWLMRLPLFR